MEGFSGRKVVAGPRMAGEGTAMEMTFGFDKKRPQGGREIVGGYYEGTHPVFQQDRFFTALRPVAGRGSGLSGGPVQGEKKGGYERL